MKKFYDEDVETQDENTHCRHVFVFVCRKRKSHYFVVVQCSQSPAKRLDERTAFDKKLCTCDALLQGFPTQTVRAFRRLCSSLFLAEACEQETKALEWICAAEAEAEAEAEAVVLHEHPPIQ